MDLLKAVLVDDETSQIELIESFLKRYSSENPRYSFETRSYTSPMEFISTYKGDADLLFLDIRMAGMTGMDLAKEIRKTDSHAALIFITSLAQYAIEGYSVDASDYILKPVNYPEFKIKLTRVLSSYTPKKENYFCIKTNDGIYKLSTDDVTYLETSIHIILYHTADGNVYKKYQSMKEAEESLQGQKDFYRINSCYIVNFRYVDSIQNHSVILKDKTELSISRSRLKEVNEAFLAFRS